MDRRDFLGALGASVLLFDPACVPAPAVSSPTGYLSGEVFLRHDPGETHPESPARMTAIQSRIEEAPLYGELLLLQPEEALAETVALVHSPAYIDLVRRECASGSTRLSTGDTAIGPESYSVALHGVGGVIRAVDAVMSGRARNAFCALRPPGHHASAERGMGFCIFNNVAIAARYAQRVHGVERVLIADWDVHHGNGTQDTFYRDGSVFFMSTHQSPLYPGTGMREETGEGAGAGLTLNRPFPPGAGNEQIVGAFRNELLPAAREFRPDLTLISAGFDSRTGDRLGSFEVDDQGFRELTRVMLEIAHMNGGGRLVSVLEGGYTPSGLASAALAHLDELSRG